MKKKKAGRVLLSFLLTLAMVIGFMPGMGMTAHADNTETLLTTITPTGLTTYSETTRGVVTVSQNSNYYSNNDRTQHTWMWQGNEGTVEVSGCEGYTITKVIFKFKDKNPVTASDTPFQLHFVEDDMGRITCQESGEFLGVSLIEVYGYANQTTVAVTGVSLNKNSTTLTVGGTVSFTATVEPNDATDKYVTWSSNSDALKLYADSSCTVALGTTTGVAAGQPIYAKGISLGGATVTATSRSNNDVTASCDVTVISNTYNSDGSLIVESADGAPACEAGGLTSDDILAIAAAENFAGRGADDLALNLEVSNIDGTVSAAEREIAENYAAAMGEDVRIAMYTDMSLFLVGGVHRLQVTDLGRKALTVSMTVPDRFRAPAGFTRHFIVIQIHDGTAAEVGRSTSMRVPVKASRFSTYILAYYDVEDGGSGSHEHSHHICEDGHKFAYGVMQAPTTEVDGFAEWRCTQCGIYDWNDHDNADARETVTLSAYPVFNDTLENNIKAAEAGATVSIETKRWVSVRRGVLEALAEKPGVTLSIGFAKDGTDYVLTIPGGDPALAGILASGDRFFSFTTLGNTYGLTAVEK